MGAPSRFAFSLLFTLAAACCLLPASAHAQTELGSEDDLTVLGVNGAAADPDVEIKGFTVFGSTQADYNGAVVGAGNVVVNGVLAVSSGSYFVGNSTFTGAGKIFITDGSAGQILRKNSAGYLEWSDSSVIGDNLGSHIATQNLAMNTFNIVNVGSITAQAAITTYSSMTVAGNAFSVGESTFVVTNGYVGIGTTTPQGLLHVGAGATPGLLVTSAGNVGIGVTSPGYPFVVRNTGSGIRNTFVLENTQTAAAGVGTKIRIVGIGDISMGEWVSAWEGAATTDSYMTFTTRGSGTLSERLRIASTGNVGIGTADPGAKLDVQETNGAHSYSLRVGTGTAAYHVVVTTLGNIGFGTQTPASAARVDIKGADTGSLGYGLGVRNNADVYSLLVRNDGGIGMGTLLPTARLDVVSTGTAADVMAQVWRDSNGNMVSSMSATGVMKAVRFEGSGAGLTGLPGGASDNLGNHVATTTLNMAQFPLVNVSSIAMVGDGLRIATSVFAGASGIFISTGGAIQTTGAGYGTVVGDARGMGAVDLQTYRYNATEVASGRYSVIGGGGGNTASGDHSFVGGGYGHMASADDAVVVGGNRNTASGDDSFVGAGYENTASGLESFVGGGYANTASGENSFVGGGTSNTAQGNYSWAGGYKSSSTVDGSFTWADSQGTAVRNTVVDRTAFKNRGGFMITAKTGTLAANQAMLEVVSTGATAGYMAQIWRDSSGIIVASMSATGVMQAVKYTGDGSGLSGISGGSSGPSIDVSTINATVTTPYGGVNITTNVFVNGGARLAKQVTQAANSGITLTSADFGKTITVNSASAQVVYLPSVTAADIGATVTVVKLGAGRVTIDAPAGAYIADSASGGTIYNTAVLPVYAVITLRLATSTVWLPVSGHGAWVTTN